MNTSRRLFLAGASLIAVNLAARRLRPGRRSAPDAASPDVIGDILKSDRRGNWSDDFDAQASQGDKVASKLPIFSPQTVTYLEQAIGQYQQIVAQGGWPMVPATKKLKLGVDRSRRRGAAQAADGFGRPVAARRHVAILRHLCRRRGEALPGPSRPAGRRRHGQVHLCGAEHQRAGAARPARDQSGAAALDVRLPRRPLCDGQHPGRPDRGGRERPRRAAPHRDRRQDRPPDPDRQFQDQRDHRQSLLERAGIDRAQGHHSADAEGSELSDEEQHPHPRAGRQRDRSDDDRLEHRGCGEVPPAPGSRAPATPWPR